MASIKIKHLEQYQDRHGRLRIYYRNKTSGKPRIPLRGPVGSPEFWEDYQNASHGIIETKPAYQRSQSGTIRWLIEQYYQNPAFKELKQGTRAMRRNILENFSKKHGTKRYAQLLPRHLRKIRDEKADTPEAANNMIKAIRQVFKYAVNYDYMDDNPARNIEKLKPKNRTGFHAWTIEEVQKFEDTHPIGTKARLAFALLLYTGQRRGDIVTMGRQHVKNRWMKFTQQKTGKAMEIPVLNELERIINNSKTGDLTYLITAYGKPHTPNGFGTWFRKVCNKAGLPHCSAHGIRKAAAARLAELGCTTLEIMSITGHTTLAEVERYTKSAQQKQLAESVRQRIDGQK